MSESPKSIVIVDDEQNTLNALAAILTRRGYAPHTAATGAEGRALIAEQQPALIMLDLGLPDASGLELLREVMSKTPEKPVIVLTANDTLQNAVDSIVGGAIHFLSKPVDAEILLSLVERALANPT